MPKMAYFYKIELSIPSDRDFSVLSENHKIISVAQTEFKLWPSEDNQLNTQVNILSRAYKEKRASRNM